MSQVLKASTGFAWLAACLQPLASEAAQQSVDPGTLARELVRSAGVSAGICVHMGVTDGRLTAALREAGFSAVHGLAADEAAVTKARGYLASRAGRGDISVEESSFRRLPYADNLVNLIVVDDLSVLLSKGLSLTEVGRVLCPGGVACFGWRGDADPSVPDRLKAAGMEGYGNFQQPVGWIKWVKPRPKEMDDWPCFDHGPDGNPVSQDTLIGPATSLRWRNGPGWGLHGPDILMGWVSGGGRLFYRLRTRSPDGHSLRDMLVARDAYNGLLLWQQPVRHWTDNYGDRSVLVSGGRLYTPLEPGGPLCALDAATGNLIRKYDKGGGSPSCVLAQGNTLFMSTRTKSWAADADTGAVRWESPSGGPLVLADGQLFCLAAPGNLVCLDPLTGQSRWQQALTERHNRYNNPFYYRGALVVVLLAPTDSNKYGIGCNGYSAKDGHLLWSLRPKGIWRKGGCFMGEVFGAQGLVWVHADVEPDASKNNAGKRPSAWLGLDPMTGQITRRFDDATGDPEMADVLANGIHRCNKGTATENYALFGTYEFFDWATGKYHLSNVTRSACGVNSGMLPANGLVYTPPFTCTCRDFMERGLLAMACRPSSVKEDDTGRLQRGPATAPPAAGPAGSADDWPSYRHDVARSGATTASVPAQLEILWQTSVGDQITAPVVAGGLIVVGSDTHRVTALNAADGKPAWSFTAGGPVDTPPTIHAGLCLFGCRDGWVYCVRAGDGQRVWRFRAAPVDERIVVDGGLESAWPVHGSILVLNGVAYAVAGRHTGLDGGLTLLALKPESGDVVWKRDMEHLPGNIKRSNLPVALLTSDGKSFYMSRWEFDVNTGAEKPYSWRKARFVRFGDSGFRDNNWAEYDNTKDRLQWTDGRADGELLASGADITCGVSALTRGGNGPRAGMGHYRLFGKKSTEDKGWSVAVPLRMRAIAMAGSTVFVAGQPDPEIPEIKGINDSRQLEAAIAGVGSERLNPEGGELRAFSIADGSLLASLPLDGAPAFDGMAVANGRLYLSMQDGRLLCLSGRKMQ